ncbi:MAG TPA: hypothetical protein VF059_12995 [Casimicrobiaceae bacterium]
MHPASSATHSSAPPNPWRRRVIFAGAAGLAALAVARWLQPGVSPRAPAHTPGLSADGADVMRALVPAFLDGALPAAPDERGTAIEDTVRAVAVAIEGLPPATQQELRALFALLAFAPVRIVVAGVDSGWREASVAAADAFLEQLRRSRWSQKRAAYDALHQLTFAAWYASPRAWPATGYPGPPDL